MIDLLSNLPEFNVIGECADGVDAVKKIARLKPELLFLDIQIPVLNGFDVLHALDPEDVPVVVFVTAFDQHAIKAFDVNAIDYILKPIDESRFSQAVNRSLKRISESRKNREPTDSIRDDSARRPPCPCERLLVKRHDHQVVVNTNEIKWIEAADKYVRLHMASETFSCRFTMRELEGKLDAGMFIRIHRSAIININEIKEIQPYFHGESKIILNDNTALTLGRSYKRAFHAKF